LREVDLRLHGGRSARAGVQKMFDVSFVVRVLRVDGIDNVQLAGLGDVAGRSPELLRKEPGVVVALLARFCLVNRDEEHRPRVYAFESLLHSLAGDNASVVVDENYVDCASEVDKMIDGPAADCQDYDDEQAIAEPKFSRQALHCLLESMLLQTSPF